MTETNTTPPSPAGMLPNWIDPVDEINLIALRREIHRVPETGWTEFIATARAALMLSELGFKVKVGREFIDRAYVRGRDEADVAAGERLAREAGVPDRLLERMGGLTGCVAVLDTGRPGKTVGFRVELDALKMNEPQDEGHIPFKEGFASERAGVMHACGHDGHQAVALKLARFIVANKDRFTGKFKFIFQPGEEGSRGAYPIVQSGELDDVDTLLCAHITLDMPAGDVASVAEKFFCTTKIDFHFRGDQAHAGMQPQLGHNALLAAADAALLLMALPRHAEGRTRVNVGTLHAGEGRNVVAAHADMEVEVRGESETINRDLMRIAIQRTEGAAMAFGVTCTSSIMGEAVDFVPDDGIVQMITVCAKRARYVRQVLPGYPVNGSDDATLMIRRVQSHGGKAGYFLVGAELGDTHAHAAVDFNERSLVTLYDIYTNLTIGLAGQW